ncbi:thioredoxin domain-containing protein [Candidatus Uhrbacteria bacterium]|jgi:protein-disulfide isomerase|nr:thioredoxin domain-containing protein [Candidatus Uhrbacteria bacterium]
MDDNRKEQGFFEGPPKTMFVFGLACGIAVVSVFAFMLGGVNLPDADALAGGGNAAVAAVPSGGDAAVAPTPAGGPMPEVTEDDHVRGDLDKAKVVLVEYSDFECPFCGRHHPTMEALAEKYGDDVAWVYRHFPLTNIHPNAIPAAEASECAGDQGKFWEMADQLVVNQQNLNRATYERLAGDIGLNAGDFTECLDSGKYKSLVSQQQAGGAAAGVTGTPATFVNGSLVSGAVPLAQFETIIDGLLQ